MGMAVRGFPRPHVLLGGPTRCDSIYQLLKETYSIHILTLWGEAKQVNTDELIHGHAPQGRIAVKQPCYFYNDSVMVYDDNTHALRVGGGTTRCDGLCLLMKETFYIHI